MRLIKDNLRNNLSAQLCFVSFLPISSSVHTILILLLSSREIFFSKLTLLLIKTITEQVESRRHKTDGYLQILRTREVQVW